MNDVKKCGNCGKELPLNQFYPRKLPSGKLGRYSECKNCSNNRSIKWRVDNPEKYKERTTRWQKKNRAKQIAQSIRWRNENPDKYRASLAKSRKKNKSHSAEYLRKRRSNDLKFKIIDHCRAAMYRALKGGGKVGHTVEVLGCSIDDLREHLERQFKPGMTWDNWGRYGWHIDHIIPIASFDFSDPEQQWKCFHYTNLQPLWADENRKKQDKILEIQLLLL